MANKNVNKNLDPLSFGSAFKYPFNRAKGLLNIFWVFLPIIGWFALYGYGIRIIQHFVRGEFEGLPLFNFGDNLKLGFFMFLKSLPFIIPYMVVYVLLNYIKYVGFLLNMFIGMFIVPILIVNFFYKETISAYFEFSKVKVIFQNFGDYLLAVLKSIGLGLIFSVMILILVGIPASMFTRNIFLADFYGRRAKDK